MGLKKEGEGETREEESAGGGHVKAVALIIIIAPSGNRINTKRELSERAVNADAADGDGENGLFGLDRLVLSRSLIIETGRTRT